MRFNKNDQEMLSEAYVLVNEISYEKIKQAIDGAESRSAYAPPSPYRRARIDRVSQKLAVREQGGKLFSIIIYHKNPFKQDHATQKRVDNCYVTGIEHRPAVHGRSRGEIIVSVRANDPTINHFELAISHLYPLVTQVTNGKWDDSVEFPTRNDALTLLKVVNKHKVRLGRPLGDFRMPSVSEQNITED